MAETETVKMFSVMQKFPNDCGGVVVFGGHIYARSFAEAEQMARSMGAELDGEMVESICFNCNHKEIFNNSDDTSADILELSEFE